MTVLLVPPVQVSAQQPGSPKFVSFIFENDEGGRLSFPRFVTVDDDMGEVYIISLEKLYVFTTDGYPLYTLDKKQRILSPQSLAIDSNGDLYVFQNAGVGNPQDRVTVVNAAFKWERDMPLEFTGASQFGPDRVVLDRPKGLLYLFGASNTQMVVMDRMGRVIDIMTRSAGDEDALLTSACLGGDGRLYVVSRTDAQIYVYDQSRKFLFQFGNRGGSSGKLSQPVSVAIDNRTGIIYVLDYMRHTILAHDPEGTFLFEFGGLGFLPGYVQHAQYISISSTGLLFIADTFNHRIQAMQLPE